jgi:phage prohead protease, HK97 family|nr:MAG TPA: prohead serine protease [Caudoviricetes sp.]
MRERQLERRSASISSINVDTRIVEGYAIVFNSQSEDLGFYETISPSAVTEDTINTSDVFCLFNHNPEKVLARSKYGKGSLSLVIDDRGLKYSFEVPNTELGNELLEHVRRGEIDGSSFAFIVSADEGSEVWENINGTTHRTIHKIECLVDVSPVWQPAYSATSVSARAKEMLNTMEKEKLEQLDNEKDIKPTEEQVEEETTDTKEVDTKADELPEDEETTTDTEEEEVDKVEEDDTETTKEEVVEEEEKEETRNHKFINQRNKMKQRFSLLKAIKAVAENRSIDDITAAVNNAGMKEMRKAGLNTIGQIYLPTEKRAVSVATEGVDVVATDLYDIIEPLRAKNVLLNAGAKFYTGLSNNVQLPVMTGGNVGWAGEVGEVAGNTAFDNVQLTPKRLTAFVDISKMLLAQDSIGVENAIRVDLINAINSKIEATILGSGAKTAGSPAGMFNGKTPTKVTDFEGLVSLEALVEEKNVLGDIAYIASPSAKASFRNMMKGSKGTAQLAYIDSSLDGTPVYSTSNVAAKQFIVGDFSNLAIGQFGGIDITVDPFSKASTGMVRLVVNAYFDATMIRPEAFQFGTFAV